MADESTVSAEVIGFAPLGEVFASARNAKNIALKEVSNNLRLSIKQIEALESNDFASLPPAMMTRGFIRNYARLLELDAEPLLASYRTRMPDEQPAALSVQTSMNQIMPSNRGPSTLKYYVIAGLIALTLAAGWYYSRYMQKPLVADDAPAEASVSQAETEAAVLPEVALPAAERQVLADVANVALPLADDAAHAADVAPAKDLPLNKANPQDLNKSIEAQVIETVSLPAQAPKEVAVDFKTLQEKAIAKQRLANAPLADVSGLKADNTIAAIKSANIAVSEQTWVRVTDKTGAVVYEKLLQPNSEDGFNGLPPFKVLIGNAKAAKLTFLGQEVDLTEKAKNNVARITLE